MAASGWLRPPFPVNDKSWGLPEALSRSPKDADREPPAVGENSTLTWQVLPVSTVPQVDKVTMKSPGFAPVSVKFVNTSGAVPQLVMVTDCTELVKPTTVSAKFIEELPKQIAGASATPVPERFSTVGLPAASSAIVTVAFRGPTAWGKNVTLSVHTPPGAIGPPMQACATEKSFDASPPTTMLDMFSAAEPQLVTVMLWTALVVVSNWLPKASPPDAELKQITGAAGEAVPLSGTVRGLPVASSVKTRFA